jgi:cell division topological specificity factor
MQFKGKRSCGIAKDRLRQLVLTDRMGCTPEMMEMLKQDMAASLSRYMDVDKEKIEFSLRRNTGQFIASVPVSAISGRRSC